MSAERIHAGGKSAAVFLIVSLALFSTASAQVAASASDLPIREVTVFKDGHAFVLQEGEQPVGSDGNVVLTTVPAPLLGTLWPYVSAPGARLQAVVAGRRNVEVARTALGIRQLLEANPGAEVFIQEKDAKYFGTVIGFPKRGEEELRRTSPPGTDVPVEEAGNIVLIGTSEGTRAVPIEMIQQVVFKKEPAMALRSPERRNVLTFDLAWEGAARERAKVGMVYLQSGLRWIPAYHVTLDGEGRARLRLEGTLVNDLADLEAVTAHLVIGVPSFVMKDKLDPMSLREAAAQVTRGYQGQRGQTFDAFSNTLATQVWAVNEEAPAPAGAAGPELAGGAGVEDLYVFSVKDVTLRKGERLVVSLGETTLPYQDVYTLEQDFRPPFEVTENFNWQQREQLAKLSDAARVKHQVRIRNDGKTPLTTAPALILHQDKVLGQGLMTYTPVGASVDVEITAAVNVRAKVKDHETGRVPDATRWAGDTYARVDLEGSIKLSNHTGKPVLVEVTRRVLGNVDTADHDGRIAKLDWQEDPEMLARRGYPMWWAWYSWPRWWFHFNAISEVSWSVTVNPGEAVDLGYRWNYFWR